MAPPRALKGQLVLVTGAASGIGEATALAFAGRGAKVALVDIDAAGLGRVAAAISSRGEVRPRPTSPTWPAQSTWRSLWRG